MKNIVKTGLCIVLMLILSGPVKGNEPVKVTYLGNCGFMYESGTFKILIDPFGTEFGNFFFLPSEDTKSKIIDGLQPFNNIALLLITHIHGDHFNLHLAENFLLKNKEAKMICPRQVYTQMKDSCRNFSLIEKQIISPQIQFNESKEIIINGIRLTAIRMQHGTNRSLDGIDYSQYTDYEKTENFGYVVHLGISNIFHHGDGCLKINRNALNTIKSPITIAHLGYFDWDSTSLDILKKDLHADKIIFMHGTTPGKELETEQFKKIESQLEIFKQESESKVFE
jgi:L-ascorbate metabolism protein UlaG (beta-lactamase superfamily)